MDLALSLRHVNGGLAGGIASADDDNVVGAAELGFHKGGAVIDALTFEKCEICDARFVVLRSGGEIAGFDDVSPNEDAAARNHGEFAGEAAGTMDGDGAFAVQARLHNFHAAGKDHKERDVAVADVEKNFAARDVPNSALSANPIDLRWGEARENLRARLCLQRAEGPASSLRQNDNPSPDLSLRAA